MHNICFTISLFPGESNGKLPPRTCPGCSAPEPHRSHDWALVPANPASKGWILMNEWSLLHATTCLEHHVLIVRRSKIVLYSLWYNHTCRWPSSAQVERGLLSQPVNGTATNRVWRYQKLYNTIFDLLTMSTWCSKHVEAWNKIIVKQILCTKLVNY